MKCQSKPYLLFVGIMVFAVGLLLKFFTSDSDGTIAMLSSLMSGFGAGFIAVGVVRSISKRKRDKNPQAAIAYEIAEKDERNMQLREKAGYASWYVTLFVLAILSMIVMVLDYTIPALIILAALFMHIISLLIWIKIYDKKM